MAFASPVFVGAGLGGAGLAGSARLSAGASGLVGGSVAAGFWVGWGSMTLGEEAVQWAWTMTPVVAFTSGWGLGSALASVEAAPGTVPRSFSVHQAAPATASRARAASPSHRPLPLPAGRGAGRSSAATTGGAVGTCRVVSAGAARGGAVGAGAWVLVVGAGSRAHTQ